MKKLLTFATMISRQIFSFLKNVLIFLVNRLYKEWEYMVGNDQSYSEKASERGDLYTKQIIENLIHERASKYNPYMLDGNATISLGPLGVVMGKARVTGLSSLHRTNICSLTEEGSRLFINSNLGAGPLTYQRQIVLRFGDFERKAVVLVSVINMKVSIDFSVEKETGRNGFLLNFAINELNGFKASVNGSGYFDWVINSFLGLWAWILGRVVRNLLENEVEQYILKRLPKYQFPVEGISYRHETKICDQQEGVENNEASVSESSCMKQNRREGPKRLRPSPIGKISKHNSAKYGTAKDFRSNLEISKTFRGFLEPNECLTEIDNCLSALRLGLCSESLHTHSCGEVLEEKAEGKRDLFAELVLQMKELSRSLKAIQEEMDSTVNTMNKESKEEILKKRLQILKDYCSLYCKNEKVDDNVEYNSKPSTDYSTSSVKDFENEEPFLTCKRREKAKESNMESYMKSFLSYRDKVKSLGENSQQSKLLERTCSEIKESLGKKVEKAFYMEIKLPENINTYSIPSTKLESCQIEENPIQTSIAEAEAFLNSIWNLDATIGNQLDEHFDKIFVGMKRKGKTDSSINLVSLKDLDHCETSENSSAPNPDLKFRSPEMFQNESPLNTSDDLLKHINGPSNVLGECESRIEDSEPLKSNCIEMPEVRCISNPEDLADDQTHSRSNKISDSKKLIIEDERGLEEATETDSKESNMERYLKSFLSYRDKVKSLGENSRQSKLLERTYAEIKDSLGEKAFDMEIKLLENIDTCDSIPSTKLESCQIEENPIQTSIAEAEAFLNSIWNLDATIGNQLDEHFEKIFLGMMRKGKTDSVINLISLEDLDRCKTSKNSSSRNPDLNFRCTEMFQNESPLCTSDDLLKHINGPSNVLRECESRIDSEPLKSNCFEVPSRNEDAETPEVRCISNPEDLADDQTHSRSNMISDSKKLIIEDERGLEEATETDSKESNMERYLKSFLSYRDKVKSLGENSRQSKLLERTYAEIKDSLGEKAFDMEIKLLENIDTCDSILSTKLGSYLIETSIAKAEAFLDSTWNLDATILKKLDEHFNEIFLGMKRKERTDSGINLISLEDLDRYKTSENSSSRNPDLNFRSTEMFQNESPLYTSDDLIKHINGPSNILLECKYPIEDSEPLKSNCIEMPLKDKDAETPEVRCISNHEDLVDSQTHLRSNTVSDSKKRIIQDEYGSEEVIETDSTNLQSNGSENEVDEKAASSEDHIELERYEDSQPNENSSSTSEEIIDSSGFPEHGVCSGLFPEYCEACNSVEKWKPFPKCTDCAKKFPTARLKLNEDVNKNLTETPGTSLSDNLHGKIIARIHNIHKLSGFELESGSEEKSLDCKTSLKKLKMDSEAFQLKPPIYF